VQTQEGNDSREGGGLGGVLTPASGLGWDLVAQLRAAGFLIEVGELPEGGGMDIQSDPAGGAGGEWTPTPGIDYMLQL
jgi:hypothetical protein